MADYLVYLIYLALTLWFVALRKINGRFYVDRDIHLIYFLFRDNLAIITSKIFSVILFGCITFIYYILFLLFYHENNNS